MLACAQVHAFYTQCLQGNGPFQGLPEPALNPTLGLMNYFFCLHRHLRNRGIVMGRKVASLLLAGAAALALSGCATNRTTALHADYSNLSGPQIQQSVADLSQRYAQDPRNRDLGIHYAAALRAAGQVEPSVTVMENVIGSHPGDPSAGLAYAKALSAAGRFEQALRVVENATNPVTPDWDSLATRGAILDQMGRHAEARQ